MVCGCEEMAKPVGDKRTTSEHEQQPEKDQHEKNSIQSIPSFWLVVVDARLCWLLPLHTLTRKEEDYYRIYNGIEREAFIFREGRNTNIRRKRIMESFRKERDDDEDEDRKPPAKEIHVFDKQQRGKSRRRHRAAAADDSDPPSLLLEATTAASSSILTSSALSTDTTSTTTSAMSNSWLVSSSSPMPMVATRRPSEFAAAAATTTPHTPPRRNTATKTPPPLRGSSTTTPQRNNAAVVAAGSNSNAANHLANHANDEGTLLLQSLQRIILWWLVSLTLGLTVFLHQVLPRSAFLTLLFIIGSSGALGRYSYDIIVRYLRFVTNDATGLAGLILPTDWYTALTTTSLHEYLTSTRHTVANSDWRFLLLYVLPYMSDAQLENSLQRLTNRHRRHLHRPGLLHWLLPDNLLPYLVGRNAAGQALAMRTPLRPRQRPQPQRRGGGRLSVGGGDSAGALQRPRRGRLIMVQEEQQEQEQLLLQEQPNFDDDDDGSSFDLGLDISVDDLAGGTDGMRLARQLGLVTDEDEPSTIAEAEDEEEESEIKMEEDQHNTNDEEEESAAGDNGEVEALAIDDDYEDDADQDDDALINENDVLLDAMWQSTMSMAYTITVQSILRPLIQPMLAMGGLGMFFYSNVWRSPQSLSSSSFPSLWMIMTTSTATATPWSAVLLFGSTSLLAMAGMRTLSTTSSTSSSTAANIDSSKRQPRRLFPQFESNVDDDDEEDNDDDDARRKQI
jgi:hypothetical protein